MLVERTKGKSNLSAQNVKISRWPTDTSLGDSLYLAHFFLSDLLYYCSWDSLGNRGAVVDCWGESVGRRRRKREIAALTHVVIEFSLLKAIAEASIIISETVISVETPSVKPSVPSEASEASEASTVIESISSISIASAEASTEATPSSSSSTATSSSTRTTESSSISIIEICMRL